MHLQLILPESPAYKELCMKHTRPIKEDNLRSRSLNILLQWNQVANVFQYCGTISEGVRLVYN